MFKKQGGLNEDLLLLLELFSLFIAGSGKHQHYLANLQNKDVCIFGI